MTEKDCRLDVGEPHFKHDCASCRFLGHYENHDLYICPNEKDVDGGTVIARYGNDGPEYASGMTFGKVPLGTGRMSTSVAMLRVAYLLAADLGYVPFTWGGMELWPEECKFKPPRVAEPPRMAGTAPEPEMP